MENIGKANQEALDRLMEARPVLTTVGRASELIPALAEGRRLLHAGPPITWDRMSGPLQGAVIGAALFEGWAGDENAAREMAAGGEIDFSPCHDHGAVGPMAGVTSPSMALYVVESDGRRAFSNLNEGYGKVLRYGAYAEDVLERLRFINQEMAGLLADALAASNGGIDLRALIAEALHMGDEGHNRNKAGSLLYLRHLAPLVAAAAKDQDLAARAIETLGANALAVLNPVMAACKLMADAAHGVDGSTVVTAMARNGTDFGIRVSGLGDTWFTAPASTPDGLYFSGFSAADANPDIGDSTITETAGIGGFAMAAAPAIVSFVSGTPEDAMTTTLRMYEITLTEHRHFTIPALGFRGTPTGIDIRRVVELGVSPMVNTGIAHREAGIGQVGAGLVRPPMECFEKAVLAYAERYSL